MKSIVYVFIDASNLWEAQKSSGRLLDFKKLKDYLKSKYCATEIQCFYYSAYPADGTREYSIDGRFRFYTFLKKGLGFTVRKKPLKRIHCNTAEGEIVEEKGNMDVELTIDAMHHLNKYSTAVFFTGDSDFLGLVKYIRSRGKNVFIYSSKNDVSQELRTGADGYIDFLKIEEDIWGNELKYRAKGK